MTTNVFFEVLIELVSDLSRELPAEKRYLRLLCAMQRIFPCDAAGLLKLEGHILIPLATDGLSEDTMGRRFVVEEHPRLARLLHSRVPVRFAADSKLPDPYDGLVDTEDHFLHVHDCMGVSLYIDEQPWGVLTLDSLKPGSFDNINPVELRTFISLAEATVKAAKHIDGLQARVEKQHQLTQALLADSGHVEMIGKSTAMHRLKEEIEIVAPSPLTVLLLGETGVGKELVARQIHRSSLRADEALVYINCAALPENIAESELFGHVKGAFTGAINDRAGRFEIADNGTLFLDEVGELSLAIQAKLLRAIQTGEIQRVGSDEHIQVDVRIIAATNRDLQAGVAKGEFRADLYHRLSVYPIHVSPLRERVKDILPLAGYILNNDLRRFNVKGLRLSEEAKQALINYPWPGNVRELEHVLSRAVLKAIAKQDQNSDLITITVSHLDIIEPDTAELTTNNKSVMASRQQGLSLKLATEQFQKTVILDSLSQHSNNLASTARALGMDRSNFHRLLKRLEIN